MFVLLTDMFNGQVYIIIVDEEPVPEPIIDEDQTTGQPTIYISDEDFEAWLTGDMPLIVERMEDWNLNGETP